MPRRILHIIDWLRFDGATRQLLLLSRALAAAGWDVHIAALRGVSPVLAGPLQQSLADAGISMRSIGGHGAADPFAAIQLLRYLNQISPDVIHGWDSLSGLFTTLASVKKLQARIVAGHYRIDTSIPAWAWSAYRRLACRVDSVVTNSLTVKESLVAHSLPDSKITVIQSGVSAFPSPFWGVARREAAPPTRAELLKELHLPEDARLIGVIGRLVPEKRVKDLIWAADLLRVLHDNLRVLIIGDGAQRRQLTRYARMASDLEHIQFFGERTDVDRILPHLDVLWNGDENTGPSMAILEAQAAGVPVIASDTPSNREIVVENVTGHLIPLGTRAGRAARARATDRIFSSQMQTRCLNGDSYDRLSAKHLLQQFVESYRDVYS